jgi:hypothetical protein
MNVSSVCKKSLSLIKKAPFSRLAKTEKAESRWWRDEHFSGKRNEENGVFLQRLSSRAHILLREK